jgi:hypothetical protein
MRKKTCSKNESGGKMKTRKILFYILALMLGGCVPVMSLHPLYTEKDLILEKKLLGTWVDTNESDPNSFWKFGLPDEQEKDSEKAYELIFADDESKKGLFIAHLIKLNKNYFLDVFPKHLPYGQEDIEKAAYPYNTFFFIPFHTFIKVESFEPMLVMKLTDDDDLERLLKDDPNAVKYEILEDSLILTASTKELQEFVLKYADDEKLFSNEIILKRKKGNKAGASTEEKAAEDSVIKEQKKKK